MIERKFKVILIRAVEDRILLGLEELGKELKPEKIIKPRFHSEDARVGYEIGQAMMQGMATEMVSRVPPHIMRLPTGSNGSAMITLELSRQEYTAIGEPNVNTILTVSISIKVAKTQ